MLVLLCVRVGHLNIMWKGVTVYLAVVFRALSLQVGCVNAMRKGVTEVVFGALCLLFGCLNLISNGEVAGN